MRRVLVSSALATAGAVAVYWLAGSEGESAPDDAVSKGMTFTHQHLDEWGRGNLPKWKLILQRYVRDLNGRNSAAVATLLDPADKASFSRVDPVVGKFSASSVAGINADLADFEYPNYSRFCLRYPGGASQEVFITLGVPGGSDKRWVLRFEDASKEPC